MKHLIQVFHLLLFYALGEIFSIAINHLIPGSVLGMMLLFLALRTKLIKPQRVSGISLLLTTNMGLFFVPAGVGLITQVDILKHYWLAILVSMVASTIIVLSVVAWSEDRIEKHQEKKKIK